MPPAKVPSSPQNDNTGRANANHVSNDAVSLPAVSSSMVQFNKPGDVGKSNQVASLEEVEIHEIPDQDARKHLISSFKKGKMEKPLVDESGKVVQRLATKENWGGGELFCVLAADITDGTGTSSGTRRHVNDDNTAKPNSIKFDYSSANSTAKAKATVQAQPLAYEAPNPQADNSYESGSFWDAGHKLGQQNGGLGNHNDWVFPQNPAINQGNSRNMNAREETGPLWRNHEDNFNTGIRTDGAGVWWIAFT